MEAIYFLVEGWTGVIGLKWLGKLDFWRTRLVGIHSAAMTKPQDDATKTSC